MTLQIVVDGKMEKVAKLVEPSNWTEVERVTFVDDRQN